MTPPTAAALPDVEELAAALHAVGMTGGVPGQDREEITLEKAAAILAELERARGAGA